MNAIIGEKLGMTQIFDDENRAIPVTAVKAGPVVITQIKRVDTDGYAAVQIAFKEMSANKAGRPATGHFAKAGVAPQRHVVEVRVDDPDVFELGQTITIADVLD
jgi:large subunit ribosomal protein L3